MKKHCKYTVTGHVQGVGFRYFVQRKANELNLSGYAVNLYNGNVEVVAEGEEFNINELLKYLKMGPTRSYVEHVHTEISDFTDEYSGFEIK